MSRATRKGRRSARNAPSQPQPSDAALAPPSAAALGPIDWIRPVAAPYLRGFRPRIQRSGALVGWWFLHPGAPLPLLRPSMEFERTPSLGFFVGYLLDPKPFSYLQLDPPECAVFAFATPPRSTLHRRLVTRPDSLLRLSHDYIRWLTHRPPRFEFYEARLIGLIRRGSMREWPPEDRVHLSRNFFIEALCWLVRSALIRRLLAEPLASPRRKRRS